MPLPYPFVSGTIARAEEVNRNFNYIMEIIGSTSAPGSIKPSAEIVLGPRSTAQLTASHDTGSAAHNFFQISWNADWNKVGANWRYVRVVNNVGGTALRVGATGFEVLSTSQKTGDMHNQMKHLLRLGEDGTSKFMYLPDDLHLTNVNAKPEYLQEMRLTTVLLENPIPIYADAWVGAGTTVFNAFNYGIPKHAQAIIIRAHVTAANWSGAGMHFYRHMPTSGGSTKTLTRQPPVVASTRLNQFRGFVAHAPITGTGIGMRSGAQGVVPLGRDTLAGNFVVQRTSAFDTANVHIVGYLT